MSAVKQKPAFEAVVAADTLEAFLEPIGAVVEECRFQFDEDGVRVRAVDPANVAMVDARLDSAAFESIDAGVETLGIPVKGGSMGTTLEDVLEFASSGDVIHFTLDQETRKLKVEIDTLSVSMALIDPESIRPEPDIPDLDEDLTATVNVGQEHLDRGLDAADLVADYVTFEAVNEEFTIGAEGDTDESSLTVDGDDLLAGTSIDDPAKSLFSLNYMTEMVGAVPNGASVEVRLGDEMPIKLNHALDGKVGEAEFMCAPRIQNVGDSA